MYVKELKEMINDLPDNALVLIEGGHGSIILAKAMIGNCREPNSMGFTDFLEDGPYENEAVYFYRPM